MLEEAHLQIAEELGGLEAELRAAQAVATAQPPAAMRPRTHDQGVGDTRVLLLDRTVGLERAVQIFGVEPTANGHDRGGDVLQMRQDVA